ncbi:MAG: hypothetical protein GEV06_11165 [Luteitalea sp.]|nr:hypothetical protein [Luteitalea sp.]
MTRPELRRLTAKMVVLGMLLMAVVLLATPAHAAVAAAGPEACWNPCTLLQIIFPKLMCVQACF